MTPPFVLTVQVNRIAVALLESGVISDACPDEPFPTRMERLTQQVSPTHCRLDCLNASPPLPHAHARQPPLRVCSLAGTYSLCSIDAHTLTHAPEAANKPKGACLHAPCLCQMRCQSIDHRCLTVRVVCYRVAGSRPAQCSRRGPLCGDGQPLTRLSFCCIPLYL